MLATATYPERIEILFYVDDDDPARPDYERSFGRRDRVKLITGPAIGVPQSVNRLLGRTAAEILLLICLKELIGNPIAKLMNTSL